MNSLQPMEPSLQLEEDQPSTDLFNTPVGDGIIVETPEPVWGFKRSLNDRELDPIQARMNRMEAVKNGTGMTLSGMKEPVEKYSSRLQAIKGIGQVHG